MSTENAPPAADQFVASAHSKNEEGYRTRIRVGHHELIADEPVAQGGQDEGAAPYALLLASLAACTSITLAMYAKRKSWELGELKIDVALFQTGDEQRIARTLHLAPQLTAEQRTRLAEIAEKTPVTKTLKRALGIVTTVA